MNYVCTLLVVRDIEKSKKFYRDLLDQEVIADLGANVTLTGGFALQTAESWSGFIHKKAADIQYGSNNAELYFEEDDMEGFMAKLGSFDVSYVHPLKEHSWGQRVVRFYDLDGHIIEVGENMAVVVRRFLNSGMTMEQAAARMDVPLSYVEAVLAEQSE